MIIGREYVTRLAVAALIAAGVLLVGTIVVWQVKPPASLIHAEPLDTLRGQVDALKPYSDDTLATKMHRKDELVHALWKADEFEPWQKKLADELKKRAPKLKWKMQDVHQEEGNYSVTHRYVLTFDKAKDTEWPAVYGTLTSLDTEHGIIVHGLALSQPRNTRHYEQIQVIFSIPFVKEAHD